MVPKDLRYTSEHEWIRVENGIGTVGITSYAQEQLGDIVFVELPEVGREVKKEWKASPSSNPLRQPQTYTHL